MKVIYVSGEDGGVGYLGVKNDMEYNVEGGTWGDNIMLGLISCMWGVMVSILYSESCAEMCLWHYIEAPECELLNHPSTLSIFRYAQLQQCLLGS